MNTGEHGFNIFLSPAAKNYLMFADTTAESDIIGVYPCKSVSHKFLKIENQFNLITIVLIRSLK